METINRRKSIIIKKKLLSLQAYGRLANAYMIPHVFQRWLPVSRMHNRSPVPGTFIRQELPAQAATRKQPQIDRIAEMT
jgi:hypothetical protein